MPITLPPNVSPGSPITMEYATQFSEAIAAATPANALTAHGTLVSNATTNTALVTVPASIVAAAVAGSAFLLKATVLIVSPASAGPTLAFNGYSGGSAGTALATMTAFTPTVSLTAGMVDVEMSVTFYSATTVQCTVKATAPSSASTSAAAMFLAGNASATPVTINAGNTLTLNAVMGSAVSGSSYEAIAGYYTQES
jgi:hypothetical protein